MIVRVAAERQITEDDDETWEEKVKHTELCVRRWFTDVNDKELSPALVFGVWNNKESAYAGGGRPRVDALWRLDATIAETIVTKYSAREAKSGAIWFVDFFQWPEQLANKFEKIKRSDAAGNLMTWPATVAAARARAGPLGVGLTKEGTLGPRIALADADTLVRKTWVLRAAPWWYTELDVTELLKDASGDELTFIELEHQIPRGKFNKWIFKATAPREATFYSHPLEGLPHDFVSDGTLDIEINVDSGQREKKKKRYTRKGGAQAARSLTKKDDDNAKASGPSASAPQLPKYMQEVEVIDLTDLPGIATRGPVIRDASADTVNDEAIAKATQEW